MIARARCSSTRTRRPRGPGSRRSRARPPRTAWPRRSGAARDPLRHRGGRRRARGAAGHGPGDQGPPRRRLRPRLRPRRQRRRRTRAGRREVPVRRAPARAAHGQGRRAPQNLKGPGPFRVRGVLDLPPDELRALGHYVWDRLVDRWEALDEQPPIAPFDPEWGAAAASPPCPDGPSDRDAGDRRALRRDPAARAARRPPALLRPHRQPEQPAERPRRPDRHRPQRVRGQLDRRGGRLRGRARRARLAARVDGDAARDRGDPGQRRLGRHAHRARRRRARPRRGPRRGHRATSRSTPTPRSPRRGGCSASTRRTCACCEPTPRTACRPRAVDAAVHLDREAHLQPFVVIGTAGTTSTGSVDALNDLADLAQREGMWFHVDGAYGAPAKLTGTQDCSTGSSAPTASSSTRTSGSSSPTRSARCSSATTPRSSTPSRSTAPTCATPAGGVVEFRERGPQLTRSARALKLYLSLKVFGLDAFKQAIQRGIDLAEHAERLLERERPVGGRLTRHARHRLLPPRRRHRRARPTRWCARAVADGFAAPSTTILDGRTVARLCTINPRTTESGHRAHDRAPRAALALRHLNTRHVAPALSSLRRSDRGGRSIGKGDGQDVKRRIGLAAVLAAMGSLAAAPIAGAAVLTVDDDGKDCPAATFPSIQNAIFAAAAGRHDRRLSGHVCGGRRWCRVQRPDHHPRRHDQGRRRRPGDDQAQEGPRQHEHRSRKRRTRASATRSARSS